MLALCLRGEWLMERESDRKVANDGRMDGDSSEEGAVRRDE
jgi:hypothetical protein